MELPDHRYDPNAGVGLILGTLFGTIIGCALLVCTCCVVSKYMEYKQNRIRFQQSVPLQVPERPPTTGPILEEYIQTILPDHSIAIAVREHQIR